MLYILYSRTISIERLYKYWTTYKFSCISFASSQWFLYTSDILCKRVCSLYFIVFLGRWWSDGRHKGYYIPTACRHWRKFDEVGSSVDLRGGAAAFGRVVLFSGNWVFFVCMLYIIYFRSNTPAIIRIYSYLLIMFLWGFKLQPPEFCYRTLLKLFRSS